MYKYIVALTALSMAACSHTQTPQSASSATEVEVHYSAPITASANTTNTESETAAPVTIEASDSRTFQAIRCHDELDCLQKMTGVCKNGYTGGMELTAENGRKVGIAFHCITDEEKMQEERQAAQRKEEERQWREARQQEIQQRAEEAKKAAAKKK